MAVEVLHMLLFRTKALNLLYNVFPLLCYQILASET